MPSTSTLTSAEKSAVKKYAPTAHHDKIHAAAIGRVYYAYPDPAKWSYSGIAGAVVFGWGDNGGWIKVVDLAGTRGVIWQHAVVQDMPYYQDRTFFHTFPSDDCMIGIAFSSEAEAAELFKKTSMRNKYAAKHSGQSASSAAAPPGSTAATSSPSKLASAFGGGGGSSSRSKKRKSAGVDKSMIGAPTGFSHVSHMGFDAESGFTSRNIDPSWERLFQQLESQGISRTQIEKNEDFIRNFVQGSGGPAAATSAPSAPAPPPPPPTLGAVASSGRPNAPPPPPPPPASRGSGPSRAPPPPAPSAAKRVPPPAPPSRGAAPAAPHRIARKPPPPPSRNAAPPAPAAAGIPPPPPPPPPARGVPAPPPPPPPARGGAPPPPPAPPGGAPPPPPPPAVGGDTRNALLASIQGKGVGNLRKTDKTAIENAGSLAAIGIAGAGVVGATSAAAAAAPSVDDSAGAAGGGGDLASALAAALSQRKGNMGESDEEEESDEDW
ncbi:hypothetical protein BMF94_2777 [Rhodotorula taiwanensis]|uniref:Uncharacterized protein n=1 Tax=Rhodotorula taiwanensis TaxID=741276 RepID=A0A2S5BBT0_9BASI|nr:hypothetical protein BMF94_2777 [Rhodotorula taiwanensis]